jgi:hypothetical protein
MRVDDTHFHDTKIHRVIEDARSKTLTMEVSYPVDWDQNVFEKRLLVFEDVHHYQVLEWERFLGEPTIMEVEVLCSDDRWSRLRVSTNAGYRELSCASVRVVEHSAVPNQAPEPTAGSIGGRGGH